MLMGTITGINDACLKKARKKMWCASCAVSDNNNVGVEGLQIARGILECLALFQRGCFGSEVDNIGAQPLRCQFKTDSCSGRRLYKEIDDRLTAQRWNFLDCSFADSLKCARRIQHSDDLIWPQ